MEDIKKAIEKEVGKAFDTFFGLGYWEEQYKPHITLFAKKCVDTALSKWEESTRWRKVEEELPERKDKGYFILVRSGDIMDAYYVYPDTNYEYLRDWKEWKPIH